jgi:hypothetical protein
MGHRRPEHPGLREFGCPPTTPAKGRAARAGNRLARPAPTPPGQYRAPAGAPAGRRPLRPRSGRRGGRSLREGGAGAPVHHRVVARRELGQFLRAADGDDVVGRPGTAVLQHNGLALQGFAPCLAVGVGVHGRPSSRCPARDGRVFTGAPRPAPPRVHASSPRPVCHLPTGRCPPGPRAGPHLAPGPGRHPPWGRGVRADDGLRSAQGPPRHDGASPPPPSAIAGRAPVRPGAGTARG